MYKMKIENRPQHLYTLMKDIMRSMKKHGFESEEHINRCSNLTVSFAKKNNLSSESITKIEKLARFHDIGNIRVSSTILAKPAKLSDEEFLEIKQHPIIGFRIAKAIPDYAPIAELILYHHERWDGNGYPSGLKGKDIPLICRIFSIVDSFDRITNGSDYKSPESSEFAINELQDKAGTQFDPELTADFISFIKEGHK